MSQEYNRVTKANVEGISEELEKFQKLLHPFFKRKEQKQHSDNYLRGLIHPLPNKSIETMMLHMYGKDENNIRAMQHFMSVGSWDDEGVLQKHWQLVDESIGDDEGVIIVDGSGFPKQGENSVGVKRQWCGQRGKVDNCQVGVFMGYATQQGRTLLDRRLYLPEEWVETKAYADRRKRCGVPETIEFKTKPTLGAEMVSKLAQSKLVRFRWLTADEEYGRIPDFLDGVGKVVWYLAEVPTDTRVWLKRPKTILPQWKGIGRKPTIRQLAVGEPASQTVAAVAAAFSTACWQRLLIKDGSKGPIMADLAAIRVTNSRQQLPGSSVWLVCRRNILTGEIHYFLSNAPASTSLNTFATIAGMRWPIETCFEEGKQELGMGDYQLRSWVGWHHHMTLVILAHGFLMRVRHQLASAAPNLTLPQVILLLKAVLPQPEFDIETSLDIVNYYQQRHSAASRSHRKRRIAQLNQLE